MFGVICIVCVCIQHIPDLKLDALAIQIDSLDLEINTNRSNERGSESIIRETEKKARLADT